MDTNTVDVLPQTYHVLFEMTTKVIHVLRPVQTYYLILPTPSVMHRMCTYGESALPRRDMHVSNFQDLDHLCETSVDSVQAAHGLFPGDSRIVSRKR